MEPKRDYNRLMEEQIAALAGARPPLLLHVCCAPCASAVLERLDPYFQLVLYYYNPNTWPRAEYDKRFEELPKLLRAAGKTHVELLKAEYDEERFFAAVRGLEGEPEGGARCPACYTLRLEGTALEAKRLGLSLFGSTLSVSPHKNAALLNSIGQELAQREGLGWLWSDFKKKDGYLRSIRLSEAYGLYRQCYCGCLFSKEAGA